MENNEKKHYRLLMGLLFLLVGLLVFWGASNQRGFNSQLRLIADRNSLPKKIDVSKEVYNLQDSFANVAEAVKPATVNISVVQLLKLQNPYNNFYFGDPFEDFFPEFFGTPRKNVPRENMPQRKMEGTGSGVIIDPKGYVLTNYHVIEGADEIKVTLSDGKTLSGKVIGKDSRTDLSVIKISSNNEFSYAPLGNSDNIRIGDWAIAIGSPFGLEQTVTVGIISAKRQSLNIEGKTYREMIQTDASINRGNSGGPLLNIKGEVIGINTAIYAPTGVFAGIGFAVPINKAKEILDDLIHKGKVVRGWLGIEITPVNDVMVKNFNLPEKFGALVNGVIEGSAAEKGGIKRGDVIVEVDGIKIKDQLALQDIVSKTEPGKVVKVAVIRNGRQTMLNVKLGEMPNETGEVKKEQPKSEQKETSIKWMGMEVMPVSENIAQQYGIDNQEKGVVVISVDPAIKADDIGLAEGDLIKGVNQQAITTIIEFKNATDRVKLSSGVMFDIVRQGKPLYITYSE
jgi:serine protease Do